MRLSNKSGLTLVEVLVSVTIFVSVLAGVLAVFVSGNRLSVSSKYRLEAINLARSLLERLKAEVRQDTWDTGNLRILGNQAAYRTPPFTPLNGLTRKENKRYGSLDGKMDYAVGYRVVDTGASYRRVDVKVDIMPAS